MIYSINISLFFIFFIDNLVVFLSICCKKKHPRNSKCRKLLCEREGNITNTTGRNVYYNASNRIAWSAFLPIRLSHIDISEYDSKFTFCFVLFSSYFVICCILLSTIFRSCFACCHYVATKCIF